MDQTDVCPDCMRDVHDPAPNTRRFPGAHHGYTPWPPDTPGKDDMTLHETILAGLIVACITVLLMWLAWLWLG